MLFGSHIVSARQRHMFSHIRPFNSSFWHLSSHWRYFLGAKLRTLNSAWHQVQMCGLQRWKLWQQFTLGLLSVRAVAFSVEDSHTIFQALDPQTSAVVTWSEHIQGVCVIHNLQKRQMSAKGTYSKIIKKNNIKKTKNIYLWKKMVGALCKECVLK